MAEEYIKKIIKDHERRILILEGKPKTPQEIKHKDAKNEKYSGATGGIRYLISKKFFKEKHDLSTIRGKLSQEGYHYSRQAVHEALKTLSKTSGPLVALKEGKRKTYYVDRK